MKQNIMVFGANGYLGWNLVCRLAQTNNGEILCIDNYRKENTQKDLFEGKTGLNVSASLTNKIEALKRSSGKFCWNILNRKSCKISSVWVDVTDCDEMEKVFREFSPTIIINLAQQSSSSLSMNSWEQALESEQVSVGSTMGILWCMKKYCPEAFLVLRGGIECFGKPELFVNEGKFTYTVGKKSAVLPFPLQPSSFAECSKASASLYAQMCCKKWGFRIVEFKQGSLYGFLTSVTRANSKLHGSLCYDKMFGTVVNRMCVQALISKDISVYGSGEQKIGIISLDDVIESYVSVINKFDDFSNNFSFFGLKKVHSKGFYKVINQVTDTTSVKELARIVQKVAKDSIKSKSQIIHERNVRGEKGQDSYVVVASTIYSMGAGKVLFADTVKEMLDDLKPYSKNINPRMLDAGGVVWS